MRILQLFAFYNGSMLLFLGARREWGKGVVAITPLKSILTLRPHRK